MKLGALKQKIEGRAVKDEKNDNEEDEDIDSGAIDLEKLIQLNVENIHSHSGLLDEIRDLLSVIRDRLNIQNIEAFGEAIHKLAAKSIKFVPLGCLLCFFLLLFSCCKHPQNITFFVFLLADRKILWAFLTPF